MTDSATHILVVDDDPQVRKLLRRCFETEGYRISEAADGAQLDKVMATDTIDLITLDLGLGSEDGLTIARDIRSRSQVPIIMLTGKGDMIDKVVGLEIGADDYIAKPFHVREVLARVRSVIRRTDRQSHTPQQSIETPDGRKFRFGDWVVDFAKFEIRSGNEGLINLTSGEFRLLEVLVNRPNRILSRDQLMDLLKGNDWNPNDRSIDNQIARLRKKIETGDQGQTLIKTIRGVGYSFTADVEAI